MEEISFMPNETKYTLVFLSELDDTLLNAKNKPLLIVGTIVQICRSNENMCVFFFEDCTQAHIAEFFRNKLPKFTKINEGDLVEIKGLYSTNKYGEKILRVFKLRKINLDEEYLHYMEILAERKANKDTMFNEVKVIEKTNKQAQKSFISVMPRENIVKRKLFSSLFTHFIGNYTNYEEFNGYLDKDDIFDITAIQNEKKRFSDQDQFNQLFEEIIELFINFKLMGRHEEGYVINLEFFSTFIDTFYEKMKTFYRDQISFRQFYVFFNEMLEDNEEYLINKESVYEFVNEEIHMKRLYFINEKKEIFGIVN